MHDVRYDPVNDEILVTNPFAQAILTFKGDADGNATPIRIIQGPKTKMGGVDRLDVDVVHNEIFVPDGDRIVVYPRTGNGDVPPLRIIQGDKTHLRSATTLSIDPLHNLLAVGLNKTGRAITVNADGTMKAQSSDDDGALMVFNRLDEGNVAPRTLVRGPKSGIVRITQMAVYSPRKFMIATQPGEITVMEPPEAFVGVWSMDDNGDVPPLYRIGVGPKTTMKKPRGVVLDEKHKEMIIADMRLNAVLTFSFPEIF